MGREFADRSAAGAALADALVAGFGGRADVTVVAVWGGGVLVGAPVARLLGAPLAVLAVARLRLPHQPDLPWGAVVSGGEPVVNAPVLAVEGPDPLVLRGSAEAGRAWADATQLAFPLPGLGGRTVVLVDEGAATGVTIRAGVGAVRAAGATTVVVALPVAPRETVAVLARVADTVVCLRRPLLHRAVAWAYDQLPEVADESVRSVLRAT